MVEQEAEVVLIAPLWPSQSWYPRLLGLLTLPPLRIDTQVEVIMGELQPELDPPSAVWPISGNTTKARSFQEKLQISSHHGGESPHSHTTHFAGNGSAGTLKGSLILFQDLYV